MKIVSRILPADEKAPAEFWEAIGLPEGTGKTDLLMVFATRVGKKTVITGATLGDVLDGRLRVSVTGQRVCERVASHVATGSINVVECKYRKTAKQRALDGLAATPDGAGLIIVCRDSDVYDAFNIVRTFGVTK